MVKFTTLFLERRKQQKKITKKKRKEEKTFHQKPIRNYISPGYAEKKFFARPEFRIRC